MVSRLPWIAGFYFSSVSIATPAFIRIFMQSPWLTGQGDYMKVVAPYSKPWAVKIGRASCRERVKHKAVGEAIQIKLTDFAGMNGYIFQSGTIATHTLIRTFI